MHTNPTLKHQAIGLGPDGSIVAAQLWAGLPNGRDGKPRWSVVFVKDGYIAPGGRTSTEHECKEFFAQAVRRLAEEPLTEAEAREQLAGRGHGITYCPDCACILPIGGRFCTACGRPGGTSLTRGAVVIAQPAPGSNARPMLLAEITVP